MGRLKNNHPDMVSGGRVRLKGPLHSWAKDGSGCPSIELKGRAAIIDCSNCKGMSDLTGTHCFMSVAERLPPGFSGEVVLRGAVDRSYSGPMVDALVSSSEVLDRLEGLRELAMKSDKGLISRGRSVHTIEKANASFRSDPCSFLDTKGSFLEGLNRGKGNGGEKLFEGMEDVFERAELMLRKLRSACNRS